MLIGYRPEYKHAAFVLGKIIFLWYSTQKRKVIFLALTVIILPGTFLHTTPQRSRETTQAVGGSPLLHH